MDGKFHASVTDPLRGGAIFRGIQKKRPIGGPVDQLTVQLDGSDDLFQVVFNLNRSICKGGPVDAAAAEDAVEFILIVCMVRHGRRWIL
jgi:hypothetical protein